MSYISHKCIYMTVHVYTQMTVPLQGVVTPIDAVVSAATGVTMGSQGHGGFAGRSRGHGGFVDGHRVTEVVRSLKIIDYYFLLLAPAFA